MFGGNGYNNLTDTKTLNELWSFNPNTMEWTWMSGTFQGSGQSTAPAYYGTQGKASTLNVPSSRRGSCAWTVGNQLYFFGGTASSPLSDLWKYPKIPYNT